MTGVNLARTAAELIAAERQRNPVEDYFVEPGDRSWRTLWQGGMAFLDSNYTWPWPEKPSGPSNVIRNHIRAGALAAAACEVAEEQGLPPIEWYPAKGLYSTCEKFLDDVLAGAADLELPGSTATS